MNLRSLSVSVVKKTSSEELTMEAQRAQRNARRKNVPVYLLKDLDISKTCFMNLRGLRVSVVKKHNRW